MKKWITKNRRQQNGLDYNGWLIFIFQRWLMSHKMGFLIPFTYSQDDYSYGCQTLYVRRWGKLTIEKWQWPEYRDHEILDRLKKIGVINRWQLYQVIRSEAKRFYFIHIETRIKN